MKRRDFGLTSERGGRAIRDAVIDALEFASTAIADNYVRDAMLRDLGMVNRPALASPPWQIPPENMTAIRSYRQSPDFGAEELVSFMDDLVTVVDAVGTLVEDIIDGDDLLENLAESGTALVFDLLASNFIRLRYPRFYWIAQPFAFINSTLNEHSKSSIFPVGFGATGLWSLLKGGNLDGEAEARLFSLLTFVPLAALLAFQKFLDIEQFSAINQPNTSTRQPTLIGLDLPFETETPKADAILQRALSFALHGIVSNPADGSEFDGSISASMLWMPREHGGPGLFVAFGGAEKLTMPIGDSWQLSVELGTVSGIAAVLANPIRFLEPADASATVTLERVDDRGNVLANPDDDLVVVPDGVGTRLEFSGLAFSGEISRRGAGLLASVRNATLVIDGSQGDGLVAKVFGQGETRIDFELGVGLDTDRGLYLEGGSGVEAIPEPGSGGRIEVSAGARVTLGAFSASVDRIGLKLDLESVERDGINWPVPSFGFKPPNGVGLVVNHSAVTGGGYLYFDPDNGRYAGVVHLQFGEVAFKAIGLIATRVEGGERGFSMLLIASVEGFQPIPLGFGFTLNAIGGIVGYNRTADLKVLRNGLRNRTLDSVLYPENPVRDAPRIISNLRQVFPPKNRQFLVGLTGVIEWGPRSIVSLDIGVIFERPSPTRLLLLGQLQARFPQRGDDTLVKLNIDFVGGIDFDEGSIFFDAALRESKIFKVSISGEAAMRMRYKSDPMFALAIGGFHPDFPAISGFPKLKKLTLDLAKKKDLKVRLTGYLGLTAATVQFGAQIDLFVKRGGFSVEGFLGFDAMLDWSTGKFTVGFGLGVTVRWRGRTLFGVYLDATLTGPVDLRIQGKAKVKIWRWSYTKSFNKSLGGTREIRVQAVDPLPELVAALTDPRSWTNEVVAERSGVVTLTGGEPGETLRVHPLGAVVVRQNLVPLNTSISLYAGAAPRNDNRFAISEVSFGAQPAEAADVADFFAAGQFMQMSEAERLVRPSFELMDSGIRLTSDQVQFGGQQDSSQMVTVAVEHETNLVDNNDKPLKHIGLVFAASDFQMFMNTTAVARSAGRAADAVKFKSARQRVPDDDLFTLARTDKLEAVEATEGLPQVSGLRYSQAVEVLQGYVDANPGEKHGVQIVRDSELLLERVTP